MSRTDLTDVECAWLAGLYEGEGTAYTTTKGSSTTARVAICMTDRDVIERVERLFPSNGVNERERGPDHYKTQYEWRINRREQVSRFLRLILPYLGERRMENAIEVLSVVEDSSRGYGSGHRNKTHCPSGHPYDDENTAYNSDGYRSCKRCRRIQAQTRRAKKSND